MPNIEEQIRKAIEDGKFKDLPGKGKPLSLEENPHENPEWSMAHHILKSSGYTLPWIETRQDILNLLEEQRQALKRAWAWREEATKEKLAYRLVEEEWKRALGVFREQMENLDKRIRDLNLEVPNERFQLPRIQIEQEITSITEA